MSDFVVSARKYRPGNFEELVGQEHVSQTLKNAIKGNKIAHAFLFCGPLYEVENDLLCIFEYSTQLFKNETIKGFMGYFKKLI